MQAGVLMTVCAPAEGTGQAQDDSLGQLSAAETDEGDGDGTETDELAEMNPICPLHDEHLPIDANSLKGKQVGTSRACREL